MSVLVAVTLESKLSRLALRVPRCCMRFVAVDGLQHVCDELQGHRDKHFCLIHEVLERESA